jgi:hypothetical protein
MRLFLLQTSALAPCSGHKTAERSEPVREGEARLALETVGRRDAMIG